MEPLFTFIVDYEGHAAVSQVRGTDVHIAVSRWCQSEGRRLAKTLAGSVGPDFQARLEIDVKEVGGASNVWCGSYLAGGKLLLLHVVKTDRG